MLKIVIDRFGVRGKVLDANTGEDLGAKVAIRDIAMSCSADGLARASIYVETMEVTAEEREVEWLTRHPATDALDKLVALEFADGIRVNFSSGRPVVGVPSAWIRIDDFRGEPNTSPLAWWYGRDGRIQLDEVLLGEDGYVEGKGGCGADYCTHLKLVRPGDLPPPPARSA